jgi:hypothetical protein
LEVKENKNIKRIGKSRKIRIPRGLESQGQYDYQEDWKINEYKNTKRIKTKRKIRDWKVKENKNTKRIGNSRKIRISRGLESQEK